MLSKIDNHVDRLLIEKEKESQFTKNTKDPRKRYINGLKGEAAVGYLIGREIIDWRIGESNDFNVPDLKYKGIGVGVKTVEAGKLPVITKWNHYPQIICVIENINTVWVCGLASAETLNTYQYDEGILSPGLRDRGTKTTFYRFDLLEPIERDL